MSFQEAITTCISKYCDFQGRARRSEYWYFCLFSGLVSGVLGYLSELAGIFGVLASLASLALFLPGLGAGVRRLHDIGKSGWAILIALVPLVGEIILLVWLARDSQPGTNQYGSNPKEYSVF